MIKQRLNASIMLVSMCLAAGFSGAVVAQAQVVDPTPQPGPAAENGARQQQSAPSAEQQADFYFQMQMLQQEVLELRGMVEEQAHEIKRLKQQRMDDYLDLDRRLSELTEGGVASLPDGDSPAQSASSTGGVPPEQELADYKAAIDLVLRKQEYDAAVEALKAHLDKFPEGRYAANAQYWLGELYLKDSELEQARQWFMRLLEEFPTHSKVPDAKYKLGRVYDMMGDQQTARQLLEEVAQGSGGAANLARDYLSKNL